MEKLCFLHNKVEKVVHIGYSKQFTKFSHVWLLYQHYLQQHQSSRVGIQGRNSSIWIGSIAHVHDRVYSCTSWCNKASQEAREQSYVKPVRSRTLRTYLGGIVLTNEIRISYACILVMCTMNYHEGEIHSMAADDKYSPSRR